MNNSSVDVLIIEDDAASALAYQSYLSSEPYQILHVGCGKDAISAMDEHTPPVVLLDLGLPDMDGVEVLKHIRHQHLPSSVIVITADENISTSVEMMKLGARDYVVKSGLDATRLSVSVRNAYDHQKATSEIEALKTDFYRQNFCDFIGTSSAMQGVYRIIENAATSDATIFITGESGTGKELCARAIHQLSKRSEKQFVALNCAAIPNELMESEIFGHVKGAFTGASVNREGAASLADGGTLFLDELCELNLDLQSKLLRFIQTGTFQRVGSGKLEQVSVRFVCATNRDPLEEVRQGRFREDLYYRLHVIPIHLPPLRQREDDVLSIAQTFLNRFSEKESKGFQGFDQETQTIFQLYDWPGNVRELENVIQNVVVLNQGPLVQMPMLPHPLCTMDITTLSQKSSVSAIHNNHSSAPQTTSHQIPSQPTAPQAYSGDHSNNDDDTIIELWKVEMDTIQRAIRLCNDNVPLAAARLGISPSTIYRKRQSWKAEGKI